MILLTIEKAAFFTYFFGIPLSIFITVLIIRWATRASDIVKNQELIIHIMIQQYKKQGATDEEIKKLKEHFGFK